MNDRLFRTLLKRYEAEIEYALYKIQCIDDHNMVTSRVRSIPCWAR